MPPSATSNSAAPQFERARDVPLPLSRPQFDGDDVDLDEALPDPLPFYGRSYRPDGRPDLYGPPRYVQDPREVRRWQSHEYRPSRRERARRSFHIDGFQFRF